MPNASEKDKQNCSFWLHEEWLSPQKEQICCSFLNVVFLEKNVICTFCLAKCIRKGQKNGSFWIHEEKNGSLHRKSNYVCSFLNVIFLEKNVICTFCLAKCIRKGPKNCSFWLHEERLSRKERHLYFLPCQMHQKRKTKSFWIHEEWLSPQKEQLFCSFLNVICTFCLAKCIRKGQQNCSFWLHEEWLSPQKEQFFCSFLNVIFLEINVICTFCLAKSIIKGQKNCSFWLHEEWFSPQKDIFFCSFLNVIFLEKKTSFVLFALPNASEKDKKFVPFDYMKNGSPQKERHMYFLPCQMHQKRTTKLFLFWLHEEWLSPQKEQIFCSFLNVTFLKKNVFCTFCLPKCIRKGQKKLFLLTTWRMALTTKRTIFLFFSERHLSRKNTSFVLFALPNASEKEKKKILLTTWRMALTTKRTILLFFSKRHLSRKKNVICSFCLAKCIRKGQKNCSFWLHEEWLSPQKEQICCSFLNVFLEKNVICTFLPCQMHQKRTNKLFLLNTWRMALSTKRAIFFVPFWTSYF